VILCIDIGNTSIKIARVGDGAVRDAHIVASSSPASEIARVLTRVAKRGVDRAAIASVRPSSTPAVVRAIEREMKLEALVITHRAVLPIAIATRHPARLGVDRICAACGAVAGRARSAIIVDAGSATTVDLVLDRRFVGGVIMPGPQMMLDALHTLTARLPALRIEDARGEEIDDTVPAMLTGSRVGSAGAILAAVRLLERAAGRRPSVWVTGGHSARLSAQLPATWTRSTHLTLQGIAHIAHLNPPRP